MTTNNAGYGWTWLAVLLSLAAIAEVAGEDTVSQLVRSQPMLIGEANVVAEIHLHIDAERTLKKVEVGSWGSNNPGFLQAFQLHREGEVLLGESGEMVGSVKLAAGDHVLDLVAVIGEDSSLLNRIRVKVANLQFSDGLILKPAPVANDENWPVLRSAYPIHRQGEAGSHTTRIPGLATSNDGTLLAVYDLRYNGRKDLQEHIDIGLSRSTDGGQSWEAPRAIMDMGEYGGKPQNENGCSDPNIMVDRSTGEIFVSAVWTYGKPGTHQWQGTGSEPGFEIGTTAQFMVVRSSDEGVTWSELENWTKRLKQEAWWLFAPAPGNGITMRDRTLVMPTQGRDENGLPFSNIMWSGDHGKTWTVSSPARDDTTECAVVELSDGALMLNMRDNRNRADKGASNGRAVSVTRDMGKTWKEHPSDHGALPEPVCMASLISHQLPGGQRVLLFSNPNDLNKRRRMTIQVSIDEGLTWPEKFRLLLDEDGGAYSSLAMVNDDTVGILYESSRANLVFQQVRLTELLGLE